MTEDDLKTMREEIFFAVKMTVNGKIDAIDKKLDDHNEKHEADMKRVMPVIEAFEASERVAQSAKTSGKVILWMASFIMAVGGAWIVLKQIFGF